MQISKVGTFVFFIPHPPKIVHSQGKSIGNFHALLYFVIF